MLGTANPPDIKMRVVQMGKDIESSEFRWIFVRRCKAVKFEFLRNPLYIVGESISTSTLLTMSTSGSFTPSLPSTRYF